MADIADLRASDPKHYDDRRAHLVALGATDEYIQAWVQLAVDHGIEPGKFLSGVERMIRPGTGVEDAATAALAEMKRMWWA